MSYDVWLEIDTGGPEPYAVGRDFNYTSNVAPIWDRAMPSLNLREMDGLKAGDCAPALRAGVSAIDADWAQFVMLNPRNGWGDLEGARNFLASLAEECEAHPLATVRVSR